MIRIAAMILIMCLDCEDGYKLTLALNNRPDTGYFDQVVEHLEEKKILDRLLKLG